MTRIVALAALCALLVPTSALATSCPSCLPIAGDLNGDGDTNVVDVTCLSATAVWAFTGSAGPAPGCLAVSVEAADLSCGGGLTVIDVQLLVLLTLELPLPPEYDSDGDGCTDVVASCLDVLALDPSSPDGPYVLDLDGNGPLGATTVECDMTTDGGGWTAITLELAHVDLGGVLTLVEAPPLSGIDGAHRPFSRDGDGAHTVEYDFEIPFGYDQFYLDGYQAKANSSPGNTSEIQAVNFVASVWGEAEGGVSGGGTAAGDIGLGSPDDPGPATSFAATQAAEIHCEDCIFDFPGGIAIWDVAADSTGFRLSWGENGGQAEGWYPWWMGVIWVR